MSESFFITFNAQATIEQEIIVLKDKDGNFLVTPEELVKGLEEGEFYTSLNHLHNPYIIRILDGGAIQNIAVVRKCHVRLFFPLAIASFILTKMMGKTDMSLPLFVLITLYEMLGQAHYADVHRAVILG